MTNNFEIPDHLEGTYKRVILKAPERLRGDGTFQTLTLLHLKVGGERLASHNTELFKLILEEERIFNRWLIKEDGTSGKDPSDSDELPVGDDPNDSDTEDEDDDYAEDDASDEKFPDGPGLHASCGWEDYLSTPSHATARSLC